MSAGKQKRRSPVQAALRKEVSRTEPATLQDLQRFCSMCNSQRRCTRGLAHDAADPAWQAAPTPERSKP